MYVIRGDGMAVGVVSSLDWQASSPCITGVLIGDHQRVRQKEIRAKEAKDKEEGS